MNLAAQQLVEDDSRASRGLVSDQELVDDEVELDHLIAARRASKGKERASLDSHHDEEAPSTPRPTDLPDSGPRSRPRDSTEEDNRRRRDFFAFGNRRRRSMLRGGGPGQQDERERKRRKRLYWQNAILTMVIIASWYFFSTVISLYNKWMFSPDKFNFGFPLFVTSFHMVMQFALSAAVITLFPSLRPDTRPDAKEYALKAGPCGVATGLDIGLSNLSLKTITLSFYTMCKSSSLGFVLLFAFAFHLERPTWRLVGVIALITIGVILMVSAETQFHLVGMIEVLSASAMGGLRWSLTQLLLDKQAMGFTNPVATLFWLAPIMATMLGLCSIIFEGPRAIFGQEAFFGSFGLTLRTFGLILFPGVLAFCMTISEFMLIQRTSVVTLSVAGIFKEVATIFLATTIFHDELTPINISGLCIALFGIALYNYLKYYEYDPDTKTPKHKAEGFLHLDDGPVTPRPGDGHVDASERDGKPLSMYGMGGGDSSLFVADTSIDSEARVRRRERDQHTIGSDSDDEDDERPVDDDEDEDGPHVRLLRRQSASEAQIEDLDRALREDPGLKRLAGQQASLERALEQPAAAGGGKAKPGSAESGSGDEGWEVFEDAQSSQPPSRLSRELTAE